MQCYIYNDQPIIYNESDLKYNNTHKIKPYITQKIDKIIELKDKEVKKNIKLLSQTIKETKKNLQENFDNIPIEDLQANLDTLNTLEYNLSDFEKTDLVDIGKTMEIVKTQRLANKKKIVDLLTNIYVLSTLDNINKGNASAYTEYLKYQNLNNNIYYNQYI